VDEHQGSRIGYVLALVIGIPLGLLMGWFTTVRGLFVDRSLK